MNKLLLQTLNNKEISGVIKSLGLPLNKSKKENIAAITKAIDEKKLHVKGHFLLFTSPNPVQYYGRTVILRKKDRSYATPVTEGAAVTA